MEVITTTATTTTNPTGRPRFIPSEHQQRTGGTGTMTRSTPISHRKSHHPHEEHQFSLTHGSNGQSSPIAGNKGDTTIRDKTKLLQLAEKVHTKKSATPNYAKSFRAITSAVVASRSIGSNNKGESPSPTPTVRRTNSTMLSSSNSAPPPTRSPSKLENYKNPKLYASFSSKSNSKLTKALIRSDPAKTNIEHLVNYKSASPPKANGEVNGNSNGVSHYNSANNVGKKSPSQNGELHHTHQHHHNHHSGGGGLSSFITPLKALHASFHERSSKLGQTRTKLFSHHHQQHHQQNRDSISGSNAKLLFGTQENLHSSSVGGTSSSSSSTEDILATEIIPQSKHGHGRITISSNGNSQTQNNKKSSNPLPTKRPLATPMMTTTSSNNNNKNVTSLSLTSSSSAQPVARQRLQNGKANNTVTVTPDFLEGFRNEKSCKGLNQPNGIRQQHQYQHPAAITSNNQINGGDIRAFDAVTTLPRRNGHAPEINSSKAKINSNNNNTNPFITPDILGGCLDVPNSGSVGGGVGIKNGPSGGGGRDSSDDRLCSYFNPLRENDSKLQDDLRQLNGTNYNGTLNGQAANCINKDVSQKRKNIVVRMSYGDQVDLYGDENRDVFEVGGDSSEHVILNGHDDGDESGQQVEDIWPTSPITVSTVTPKRAMQPCVSTGFTTVGNYCGKDDEPVPTFSSFLASDSNNSHKGNGPYCGNSLRTFQPNGSRMGSSNNTGNGKTRGVIVPPPRTTSILSTASNSTISKRSPSEDQNNSQSQSQSQLSQNLDEKFCVGQTHNTFVDVETGRVHNNMIQSQPPQPDDSPEATGNSTWLQIKTSSASATKGGADENDINNLAFNLSNGNGGAGIKKQILKRAAAPTPTTISSSIINGNSVVNERISEDEFEDENDKSDDKFSISQDKNRDREPRPTAASSTGEERGRSRRGMCMEAETSLAETETRRVSRPQTALFSDEYAQYLGYDYNNGTEDDDEKVQQAQLQSRFQRLQLGNKAKTISPSISTNKGSGDGDDSEKDGVFDNAATKTGATNMTMLAVAIAATGTSAGKHGNKKNLTSIMKPQDGKRHENGKRAIQHSVSFRGTIDSPERESKTAIMNGSYNKDDYDYNDYAKTCGRLSKLEEYPDGVGSKFERKRSRSLPKSFMSVRNGLRNVLPR